MELQLSDQFYFVLRKPFAKGCLSNSENLEGTKSFFPKWRSVGPEPGRTLFFRIERTGRPAAVRPVSIPPFRFSVHIPTLPGFVPTGKHVCGLLSFIIQGALLRLAFARPPKASIGSFVVYPPAPAPGRTPPRATRSRVPRSQRLRRRRFAPPLRPPDVSRLAPSPSPNSFSPSGWNGECIAASAARRPGDPATDPHSGTRDSLPSHGRFRGQRLRRERLRRHQCPARFFGSPAECAFPSPPFRFCSSVFSALPACQID